MNSTARLAVKIQNLPDWDVDWFDTKPQQSRQALTISNILPSAEDASVLEKRAVRFLMSFLVSEFSSLSVCHHLCQLSILQIQSKSQ